MDVLYGGLFAVAGCLVVAGLRRPILCVYGVFLGAFSLVSDGALQPVLFLVFVANIVLTIRNPKLVLGCVSKRAYLVPALLIVGIWAAGNSSGVIGGYPVDTRAMLSSLTDAVVLLLTVLMLAAVGRQDTWEDIGRAVIIATTASVLLGFWQYQRMDFLYDVEYPFNGRFAFPGHPDPNYSALYLDLIIVVTIDHLTRENKSRLCASALWLFIVAECLTLSRAGVLALSVGVGIVVPKYWGYYRRAGRALFKYGWIGLLGVVIGVAYLAGSHWNVVVEVLEFIRYANEERLSGNVDTLSIRRHLWHGLVANVSWANALLGSGDIDVKKFNYAASGYYMTAHSLWLTVWLKYGAVGVAALVGAVGYVVRIGLAARNLALVSMAITYVAGTLFISDNAGFFLGVIFGLALVTRGQQGSKRYELGASWNKERVRLERNGVARMVSQLG